MVVAASRMAIKDLADEALAWAFLVSAGFTGVTKMQGASFYRKVDGGEGFSKMAPPHADWYTLEGDQSGEQVTAQTMSLASLLDRAWTPDFFWADMAKTRVFPFFGGERFYAGRGDLQVSADDPVSAYMRHRALAHFGSELVEVPGCIIERFESRMSKRQSPGMVATRGTHDDPSP